MGQNGRQEIHRQDGPRQALPNPDERVKHKAAADEGQEASAHRRFGTATAS
jgi:hypothetical protein